jgi:L-threonylcarbamoyladenylate synthase
MGAVLKPSRPDPADEAIAKAAAIIRRGGLVAFPTETVYGLGANALDATAVGRIFEAKGRPANNPIIVHVASAEQVSRVAGLPPVIDRGLNTVARLSETFWPGPLTLVLPRTDAVPGIVTAGGPTVAVRVPAHPVALALLRAADVPIAAPSANRSTRLSPTTAVHVVRGLGDRVDLILDGGPTTGGIESTVLDMTSVPPRILRPGLVTADQIEAVIGPVRRPSEAEALATGLSLEEPVANASASVRSPGMMPKHYAPRAPLEIADGDGKDRVEELTRSGKCVGWLTWEETASVPDTVRISMPSDPVAYAARLYAALHELDASSVDRIVVARPPEGDDWDAIHDRLRRGCACLAPGH